MAAVCLSVCLSVRSSVCPCVCLSVRLFVRPSACLSVRPSVHLSVRPSVCLSVCLSVRPSCAWLLSREWKGVASSILQVGSPWEGWPVTSFRAQKVKCLPGTEKFWSPSWKLWWLFKSSLAGGGGILSWPTAGYTARFSGVSHRTQQRLFVCCSLLQKMYKYVLQIKTV